MGVLSVSGSTSLSIFEAFRLLWGARVVLWTHLWAVFSIESVPRARSVTCRASLFIQLSHQISHHTPTVVTACNRGILVGL